MCNRCKWSSHTGRCLPRCLFTSELNARYVFRAGCSGVMAPLSRRALTPSVPQSWLVLGACRNSSMDPAHGVADLALLPVYRFIPLPSSALAARAIISPALRAKPWTSTAAGGVAGSKDSAPCASSPSCLSCALGFFGFSIGQNLSVGATRLDRILFRLVPVRCRPVAGRRRNLEFFGFKSCAYGAFPLGEAEGRASGVARHSILWRRAARD